MSKEIISKVPYGTTGGFVEVNKESKMHKAVLIGWNGYRACQVVYLDEIDELISVLTKMKGEFE